MKDKVIKMTSENYNKIGILIENIEVAKGSKNIINFANLVQLLQQIQIEEEGGDE